MSPANICSLIGCTCMSCIPVRVLQHICVGCCRPAHPSHPMTPPTTSALRYGPLNFWLPSKSQQGRMLSCLGAAAYHPSIHPSIYPSILLGFSAWTNYLLKSFGSERVTTTRPLQGGDIFPNLSKLYPHIVSCLQIIVHPPSQCSWANDLAAHRI